jgi:glycine C-acetyltransferase
MASGILPFKYTGVTQLCVVPRSKPRALKPDLRENHGIFCSIVVYPVIPKGLILLRMIPTATHTLEDVEETLEAFDAIRTRLQNGTYKRMSASIMASMED